MFWTKKQNDAVTEAHMKHPPPPAHLTQTQLDTGDLHTEHRLQETWSTDSHCSSLHSMVTTCALWEPHSQLPSHAVVWQSIQLITCAVLIFVFWKHHFSNNTETSKTKKHDGEVEKIKHRIGHAQVISRCFHDNIPTTFDASLLHQKTSRRHKGGWHWMAYKCYRLMEENKENIIRLLLHTNQLHWF